MNEYMRIAVREAEEGVRRGHGGPFGAVIVHNGTVIARGHNRVIMTNDPTAHAEMEVIRETARTLGRFDLSDCEIYSSCEPCPMCFSAIHWAKIKKLYFGCTRKDAADIGFDDNFIYDVIRGTAEKEQVHTEQIERENCLKPFKQWESKSDKVPY